MIQFGTVCFSRSFVLNCTLSHTVRFAHFSPESSGAPIGVGRLGLHDTDCGGFHDLYWTDYGISHNFVRVQRICRNNVAKERLHGYCTLCRTPWLSCGAMRTMCVELVRVMGSVHHLEFLVQDMVQHVPCVQGLVQV